MQDSDEDTSDSNAPLLPLAKKGISLRPTAIARWVVLRPISILRSARRHPRTLAYRLPLFFAVALLVLVAATPIFFPSYSNPPARYRELESRCAGGGAGCANPRGEKVFIAVTLYDPDGSVAGGLWGRAVETLIQALGVDNVFLSIYENDSGPEGDKALRALDARISSPKRIVSDLEPPDYASFPHATMPDGTRVLKRLSYLSTVRNRAFEPLDRFDNETTTRFDKVLFLSDAVFNPLDAAHLLFNTNADENGRANYLSACALDYNQSPFLLYDLYAQRDASGFSNGVPIFPYFAPAGNEGSRRAMLSETDAVPVSSCWGGMVAAQAAPFQNLQEEVPHPEWDRPGHHVVDPDSPRWASAPVRFRFEPEIFFDACECCLLHADLAAVTAEEEGAETGVFVNPYVRVAYSERVLKLIPHVRRFERLFAPVQRLISVLAGLPTNNPHRDVVQGQPFVEEVFGREGEWEAVERRGRSGMFCGVREMQTIAVGGREEGERGEGLVNWVNWDVPWEGQEFYFPT